MSIITWFKQLFNKQQDVQAEDLHEITFDEQGNPIDKEAAYQRIVSIVSHIFDTMGMKECFTVDRTSTIIQLTLKNIIGVTRIINFKTPEELYSFVYGLNLSQDLFHVKQIADEPNWAKNALNKLEEESAHLRLREIHKNLMKDFETLALQYSHLQQESLKNYNRRCVAENFIQVFRKHVRTQNEHLCEINTLIINAIKKGEISTHILDTVSQRLFNVQVALRRDTKWGLLSEKYLVDRGEPAKDPETEPQ